MAIQWFPGHMHKAIKEIKESLPRVDVVIEVLDARIPFSSSNPVIEEMRQQKPSIKIITKADLADADITQQWLNYFEQDSSTKAFAVSTANPGTITQLNQYIRQLVPHIVQGDRPVSAMIMGIPNVGKSTLINQLAGRSIAKTGNEPAVTKMQQQIKLDGLTLHDTPGILWPKIHNEPSSYRLAVTGAIKDTAMEYEDVAFFAMTYLLQAYPNALLQRYELDELPETEIEFFDLVGAKRGCLRSKGMVDLNKISKILLTELRAGQLGTVTLETPTMIEEELIEVEKQLAKKVEKERLRDELKQQRKRKRNRNT